MKRKYTINNNWKPFVRHHQFSKCFKNGMYGYSDARCRIAKVRFMRMARTYPLLFSMKNQPSFGKGVW